MLRSRRDLSGIVFCAVILAHGAFEQHARARGCEAEENVALTASDAGIADKFGYDVAVHGDVVVVGSYFDDEAGTDSGSAYVFRFDGERWRREAKLLPSDLDAGDRFGGYLAAGDDLLVISSYFDDIGMPDSGSAYVFRYDGAQWVEEAKLIPSDPAPNAIFGSFVALSGEAALLTARGDDDAGHASGSAYVFRFDGNAWIEEAKLAASDAHADDSFGHGGDIDGDVVIIGAHLNDDLGQNSGAAYIFRLQEGSSIEEVKLLPSDGLAGDFFGYSVAVSGDVAAVASQQQEGGAGAIYVFRHRAGTWSEEAKLIASDGQANDLLGSYLSMSGDMILATARLGDLDGMEDAGAAYVFRHDGFAWVEEQKLVGSEPGAGDLFGRSGRISGDVAVIGAFQDDTCGFDAGAAYLYRRSSDGWIEQARITASEARAEQAYGTSVALGPARAITGAPLDDEVADDAGAAFLYDFNGRNWSEIARLVSPDAGGGDRFGTAVAIDDLAVIGAPGADGGVPGMGKVFLFAREGAHWLQRAQLTASSPQSESGFASVVALNGDVIAVAAPLEDEGVEDAGAVYVFRAFGDSWSEEARIVAARPEQNARFGSALALGDDLLIVGVPWADALDGALDPGRVIMYRFDGRQWNIEATIAPSEGGAGDRFGAAVSIEGERLAIGAPGADGGAAEAGAAFVYRLLAGRWVTDGVLSAPGGASGDEFGAAVSIRGDLLVVGAPGESDDTGRAHLFRRGEKGWDRVAQLVGETPVTGDRAGESVALHGNVALVGAHGADLSGSDAGAALLFSGILDCNANDLPDLCDIAAGTSRDCDRDGTPDECTIAAVPEADADGSGILDACEDRGDLNGDGSVNFGDMLELLAAWGACDPPPTACPADLDGSGAVDFADLIRILAAWTSFEWE